MSYIEYTKGSLVKILEPFLEPEEYNLFFVLEDRGDKLLIQTMDENMYKKLSFIPQEVISKNMIQEIM